MNKIKMYIILINDRDIILNSIRISLIVGTILNFINQGDKIISVNLESINYFKVILTYCIPFMVSSYTAISMKMKFKIGEIASMDAELECTKCKISIKVVKNAVIPICDKCKEKTKWRIKLDD